MTTTLQIWANRHNVSPAALADLRTMLMGAVPLTAPHATSSEAAAQNEVRIKASRAGWLVMRNNVGVLKDDRGVPVRFGLANDSPAINKHIKSSDLIGCIPVTVTQDMVGTVVGQFAAREIKAKGWRFGGTEREQAQLRFIQLITSLGGNASFSTGDL